MEFCSALEVREKMNCAQGEFVFGIDFEREQGFFCDSPLNNSFFLWRVGNNSNFSSKTKDNNVSNDFSLSPINYSEFLPKFDIVHKALCRGNSFLTNLTIKTPILCSHSLSEIARYAQSPYLIYIPNKFVCFSPETFVKINSQGIISSNPMKGTVSESVPNGVEVLMNDPKEQAEHCTIVDLIRNDLSIVAHKVTVERFRYVEKVETMNGIIYQTSSEIKGVLNDDVKDKLGDVFWQLLPAGSVSGAPKCETQKIIKQAEQETRGYYCGVFGYSDGKTVDSAVMIRFIEQDEDGNLFFRSGSGVTAQSSSRYEYDEMICKVYLPFK